MHCTFFVLQVVFSLLKVITETQVVTSLYFKEGATWASAHDVSIVWALVQVPATPLPSQLPANALGKAEAVAYDPGGPLHLWGRL